MKVETFTPAGVMKPIGPYSHVARAGPFVTISATAAVDPATGEVAAPDAYAQTRHILKAFRTLLEIARSGIPQVLHVRVYLKHMEDFDDMNRAYAEEMGEHRPARTVIGVSDLPKKGARLTISLDAVVNEVTREL
ncbi:MAG TPA: RidA family protein [Candidatus Saccharimonadaceae bacterium]|jgi:2-iminobutanoate/2-iminopropanoate deaminase|nr:RidA family protein [Candidatus Saccharimonadaceae bacterium]